MNTYEDFDFSGEITTSWTSYVLGELSIPEDYEVDCAYLTPYSSSYAHMASTNFIVIPRTYSKKVYITAIKVTGSSNNLTCRVRVKYRKIN